MDLQMSFSWIIAAGCIGVVLWRLSRQWLAKQAPKTVPKDKKSKPGQLSFPPRYFGSLSTTPLTLTDWDVLDFSTIEPVSSNFDWKAQPEMPYRPWQDGPYHVTMGRQTSNEPSYVSRD